MTIRKINNWQLVPFFQMLLNEQAIVVMVVNLFDMCLYLLPHILLSIHGFIMDNSL